MTKPFGPISTEGKNTVQALLTHRALLSKNYMLQKGILTAKTATLARILTTVTSKLGHCDTFSNTSKDMSRCMICDILAFIGQLQLDDIDAKSQSK